MKKDGRQEMVLSNESSSYLYDYGLTDSGSQQIDSSKS